MKAHFYDIESLDNVFTLCNYKPDINHIDIFYLCDNPELTAHPNFLQLISNQVYAKNRNFNGTITLHNLQYEQANDYLASTFGLSDAYLVNNPYENDSYNNKFRLTCDTDPDYNNDIHPYLEGYNSYNYDTTMLALYFNDTYIIHEIRNEITQCTESKEVIFKPVTAHQMRVYNNELFSKRFKENMPLRLAYNYSDDTINLYGPDYSDRKYKIRKNMLMTGRHIDVARLNEKQKKVALKRLLGMLGYQILESNKLSETLDHIETIDQFADLIAYNISDVVNLKLLSEHKVYKSQFDLKKNLLERYPELIYNCLGKEYKPDKRPCSVRKDRLTIDSSSAQFATKALCPYNHLSDIPAVSFMYPSEIKAKELNIPRINVLEESRKFFYDNFPQPELRAEFDRIYYYYKSIEGKNFNESDNYQFDYGGKPEYLPPQKLSDIPKTNTCLFYYNKDGTPSSCFVTFSTGGIHGAEYNKLLYESDMADFEKELSYFEYAKSQYPNAVDLRAAKKITMPDGTEFSYTHFLKTGATLKNASYKSIEDKKPILFKQNSKGIYKINDKYIYTSADLTNHEDFTSYYPNMLRMMSAFYNPGLGYDRYAEIFDDKQKYGKLRKDKSLSEEKRQYYNVMREGTKLILNSASGAGDATFESNIRMNNQIISMRIIGQLFSWRIGQAQTLSGARIISTNTDGLYSVLEESLNNKILAQESAIIHVEIEPEPVYLISKDSNNRTEITADLSEIINASGGTLSCRTGPTPTQSLNHPAIIDWALAEYLIQVSTKNHKSTLFDAFDKELGEKIIQSAKNSFSLEPLKFLTMFQNVIASSNGSMNYIFGTIDKNPDMPIVLQHYNRVFIMKDNTPNTGHLRAACAKQLTPATISKRKRNAERKQQHDPVAVSILSANGVSISDLPDTKEATIQKVTNIDENWYMLIENRNLSELTPPEYQFIVDNLDYNKYLILLESTFEKNWRNKMPAGQIFA